MMQQPEDSQKELDTYGGGQTVYLFKLIMR